MAKKILLSEGPHHGQEVEVDPKLQPGQFFTHDGHNYRLIGDYAQYGGPVSIPEVDVKLKLSTKPTKARLTSLEETSSRKKSNGKKAAKKASKKKAS